jgi:hypothetical protein
MARKGLYANIHAKRKRGGKMKRKVQRVLPLQLTLEEPPNSEKKIMTKLCPRGKAAAKRKFDVYPSAYANAYASKFVQVKSKILLELKEKTLEVKKLKVV